MAATDFRTGRLSEMEDEEIKQLLTHLDTEDKRLRHPMCKKVIHLLCLTGMVKADQSPDYERINDFVQNIGSRNPKAKVLWKSNSALDKQRCFEIFS